MRLQGGHGCPGTCALLHSAGGGQRAAGAFLSHHHPTGRWLAGTFLGRAPFCGGPAMYAVPAVTAPLPSFAYCLLCDLPACRMQGIVGTAPWVALVYLTFSFQLMGMSDVQASLLMAIFLATNAVGWFWLPPHHTTPHHLLR